MKNDESKNTKMMPAICTQCGAQIEVDAQREKAFCQYCGMQFIVEKAINTYNFQHATIEHVDSINIVKKGSVESVLDFVKDQQQRADEAKKENVDRPTSVETVLNFVKDQQQRADEAKREKREEIARRQQPPTPSAVESVLNFVTDQQKRIDDVKREKKEEERKEKEELERRRGGMSPLGRGCLTGPSVMIVCTVLIGLPAQALDKSLFNVVSTAGTEKTYGPLFSAASFLIFFISIIGFAYGWAPKAKIWNSVILWIRSKFNRNNKTSPSLEEAAASIHQPENTQNMG